MSKMVFHIGDVLSIVTGKVLSYDLMAGIYRILEFMTGDNLMTHQVVLAGEIARAVILEEYPELRTIDASRVDTTNWREFVEVQSEKYGEFLVVPKIKNWVHKDPIQEFIDMGVLIKKLFKVRRIRTENLKEK